MKIKTVDLDAGLKNITKATLQLMDDAHLEHAEEQLSYAMALAVAEIDWWDRQGIRHQVLKAESKERRIGKLWQVAYDEMLARDLL